MSSTPLSLFWRQVYWFILVKNASHLKEFIFREGGYSFFWNSFCLLHVSFSSCDYCLLPTSSSKLHLLFIPIPYFLIPALSSSLPPPSSFCFLSSCIPPTSLLIGDPSCCWMLFILSIQLCFPHLHFWSLFEPLSSVISFSTTFQHLPRYRTCRMVDPPFQF